jgi:hypothetical protein
MAERWISMQGESVRAILAGRKTQTRRVVTHKSLGYLGRPHCYGWSDAHGWCWGEEEYPEEGTIGVACPYGQPGDTLWVRETWAAAPIHDDTRPAEIVRWAGEPLWYRATGESNMRGRWRPSIHMPRWASRLTLRVTEVRVERVQAITEADVRAEGVGWLGSPSPAPPLWQAYRAVWDAINGKRPGPKHIRRRPPRGKPTDRWEAAHPDPPEYPYAWAANPWVWAVSFEPT